MTMTQGALPSGWMDPKVMAAVVAAMFAWWRKDMLLTIAIGMAVFHLLRWIA